MLYLSAALPSLLLGLVSVLHAYAIAKPSTEPMSIPHTLIYAAVFFATFFVAGGVSKNGEKANVATIYAAHRYVPKNAAMRAYALLLISLALLAAAFAADFDPRRRSTAFWMALLSCPAIVWWHSKVATNQVGGRSTLAGKV
jgi:hypothetical protein